MIILHLLGRIHWGCVLSDWDMRRNVISILVHRSIVIHSLLSVPGAGLDICLHDDLLSRVLGGFGWCLGRDRKKETICGLLDYMCFRPQDTYQETHRKLYGHGEYLSSKIYVFDNTVQRPRLFRLLNQQKQLPKVVA